MARTLIAALMMLVVGCPGASDGTDGADGIDGADGADGKNGLDGTLGPTGPAGRGERGLRGLPGQRGPAGKDAPPCKWCRLGEQTFRRDEDRNVYLIYTCGDADAHGCGSWKQDSRCNYGEVASYERDEDRFGFAARDRARVVCTKQASTGHECETNDDCANPKQACEAVDVTKRCVDRASWITGTGTWDYKTDHFLWDVNTRNAWVQMECDWDRSTYWHREAAFCSARLWTRFGDGDGGLSTVQLYLTFKPSSATGGAELSAHATAPAHSGAVVHDTVNNDVTFTKLDFRPGGIAAGTWRVAARVGTDNFLAASGQFQITLPAE